MLDPDLRDQIWMYVLNQFGIPRSEFNIAFFEEWARFENTGAKFNPLATTKTGVNVYDPVDPYWNDNGGNPVKNYKDLASGARMTYETLALSYYTPIVESLRAGRIVDRAEVVRALRTWGTAGFATQIENGWSPNVATPTAELVFDRWPVADCQITGRFLQTSGYWSPGNPHMGVDLWKAGIFGVPVYAPAGGTCAVHVPGDGWGSGSLGRFVAIDHPGTPWYSGYAHLNSTLVVNNQIVRAGDMIGTVGFSGLVDPPNVNGAHLHWQVSQDPGFPKDAARSADPLSFMKLAPVVEPFPTLTDPQRITRVEDTVGGWGIGVTCTEDTQWLLTRLLGSKPEIGAPVKLTHDKAMIYMNGINWSAFQAIQNLNTALSAVATTMSQIVLSEDALTREELAQLFDELTAKLRG